MMRRILLTMLMSIPVALVGVTGSALGEPQGDGVPTLRTVRVSLAPDGTEVNRDSLGPAISDDGRFVAFNSKSPKLVAGDRNGKTDVFVRDTQTGITELVSVASDGTQANDLSLLPELSADGRFVTFTSLASNLDPRDDNEAIDIYIRDRELGTTELVSVSDDGSEVGNAISFQSSVSSDGRYVAFASESSNLVANDAFGGTDIFLRDRQEGVTQVVSVSSDEVQADLTSFAPSISGDGSVVAFDSDARNLVEGDTNSAADTFVRDIDEGTTVRVSVRSDGSQGRYGGVDPELRSDGRAVVFTSESRLSPDDGTRVPDAYVHDLETGTTTLASRGMNGGGGDNATFASGISDDGRYITFVSLAADIVPSDTNGDWDHFMFDMQEADTVRLSVNSRGKQARGDKGIYLMGTLSGDARYFAFESAAKNLAPNDDNDNYDIFVRGVLPSG